jgi:hypothetical protein
MRFLLSYLLVLGFLGGATSFSPWPQRIRNGIIGVASSSTRLLLALPTNLEYLAVQRCNEPAYQTIKWIDPSLATDFTPSKEAMIVPIYPIPAVYLPYTNHTLNNVEPRNLRMALDLNQTDSNKLFCVTMRATDTGRISERGTLLRMVDLQPTYRQESLQDNNNSGANKVLSRIIVSCEAVGLVEIDGIENPEAASPLQRLKHSAEYLQGRVNLVDSRGEADTDTNTASNILQRLAGDLAHIKTMYELGIGSQGTISTLALQDLSTAIPSQESIQRLSLWEVAQLWQSVCETIRARRQAILSADRNEFLVDAACRKGGPLKLPVHPEDLEPEDRQRLAKWETQVQNAYYDLQLDPCLDFLPLQSMDSDTERWQWLAKLIARERQRLEDAATFFQSTSIDVEEDFMTTDPLLEPWQEEPARRGAWFDDGVW